jgi:hypothetical protein
MSARRRSAGRTDAAQQAAAHISITIRDDGDGGVHITLESHPPVPMEHDMTSAQITALAMLSCGAELLGDSVNVRAVDGCASPGA